MNHKSQTLLSQKKIKEVTKTVERNNLVHTWALTNMYIRGPVILNHHKVVIPAHGDYRRNEQWNTRHRNGKSEHNTKQLLFLRSDHAIKRYSLLLLLQSTKTVNTAWWK
jgi:hypothetical protein